MRRIVFAGAAVAVFWILFFGLAQADLTDGLVAYYPFNGDAEDYSGNENHGSVYGPILTDDRLGDSGNAYFFDGNADFIEVPDEASFETITDELSISFWLRFDVDPSQYPYVNAFVVDKKGAWRFYLFSKIDFY